MFSCFIRLFALLVFIAAPAFAQKVKLGRDVAGILGETHIDPKVDVFLIGGQSNAVGGNSTAPFGPTVPPGKVLLYTGTYPTIEFPSTTCSNSIADYNDSGDGSAWPAFGIAYYQATGRKVLMINAARGSTAQAAANDSTTLTGTTTANATTSIVGVGTHFTSDFGGPGSVAGSGWKMSLSCAPHVVANVTYVTDDTHATVSAPLGNGTSQTIERQLNNWDEYNATTNPTGTLYDNSVSRLNCALTAVTNARYTPTFRGVLWSQGEGDGYADTSIYQAALEAMIARYRAATIGGSTYSTMPFYIFELGNDRDYIVMYGTDHPGYIQVRSYQEAVAAGDPYTKIVYAGAQTFTARGMMDTGANGRLHYGQAGYNEMGSVGAANVVLTPPAFSQSDCLFNWAEIDYPGLFAPAGAMSNTLAPYYYRYYPQTNAYLGTSSADNHVYYMGPLSNNSILDVGALLPLLSTAGCQ